MMPNQGCLRSDARKRRNENAEVTPKRRRVQPEAVDHERVTLSLDDNVSEHSKGTAMRLPLIEEIFNINSILKVPFFYASVAADSSNTDT